GPRSPAGGSQPRAGFRTGGAGKRDRRSAQWQLDGSGRGQRYSAARRLFVARNRPDRLAVDRLVQPLQVAGGRLSDLSGRAGTACQARGRDGSRSEEHTSELQSRENLVCRLLLEKKNKHK